MTRRLNGRQWTLLLIAIAGVWAAYRLGLSPGALFDQPNFEQALEFFGSAIRPALDYEAAFVPEGTAPLLFKVLQALGQTVLFAAASIGVSIVAGSMLAFFASTSWWSAEFTEASTPLHRFLRLIGPVVYTVTRVVLTLMRSVHELLWAVLLLVAVGNNHLTAVIAIAIPFSGTLAKIFAEMIDEAPPAAPSALRACGASSLQVFAFARVPAVFGDLTSYAIYRFECALRSSAILGFFGIPTIGYYLKLSFDNLHYREVWTYLYALFALVILVDAWSGRLRKELNR